MTKQSTATRGREASNLAMDTAIALHRQGRLDEAEAAYLQALDAMPELAAVWRNLGVLQRKRGNPEAAIALARRGMEEGGITRDALGNLENALIDANRAAEISALEVQLPPQLASSDPVRIGQLARLRRNMGYRREAVTLFEAIPPESRTVTMRLDHAMTLLELGRLREGFALYQSRWESGLMAAPQTGAARWDHRESLTGKHVIVFAEQGLGDMIFLARFLPLLRTEGMARLTLKTRAPLMRLLAESGLADVVSDIDAEEAPDADADAEADADARWMPAFDLCQRYHDENRPAPAPARLRITEEASARAERITAPFAHRFKIGICWAASHTGAKSALKSVELARLLALTEVPGVQLFSLHKGPGDDLIEQMGLRGLILDHARHDRDLADTAALMHGMDLVITVDTATAHLAGSLGVPTWMLTPEPAYWYWRGIGETTPYYPSLRLIRQLRPGDWDAALARIRLDLEKMLR